MAIRLGLRQKGDVLPAHLFNPGGHFESLSLYNANEEILRSIGYRWDLPPQSRLTELELSQIRNSGLLDHLRDSFKSSSTQRDWCDKDPRLSITLPIWDQILLRKIPVVICLRHPYEVANSLRQREGFPLELGIIMWRYYNQNIARNCQDREVLLLDYGRDLGVSPEQSAQKILRFAQENGYNIETDLTAEAAKAINKDYHRNRTSIDSIRCNEDRYSKRLLQASESYEQLYQAPVSDWSDILRPSIQLESEDEQWMMLYRRTFIDTKGNMLSGNQSGASQDQIESTQESSARRKRLIARVTSSVRRRLSCLRKRVAT